MEAVSWRRLLFPFCFFFLFPADDYIKMSKLFVTSKHVIIRPISVANSNELLRLGAMDSDKKMSLTRLQLDTCCVLCICTMREVEPI